MTSTSTLKQELGRQAVLNMCQSSHLIFKLSGRKRPSGLRCRRGGSMTFYTTTTINTTINTTITVTVTVQSL